MIRVAALLALMMPAAAFAQDDAGGGKEPRFCPNNPSLESSACTTEPGRVHVETTFVDWQLDRSPQSRTDTFLAADTLVRVGIGPASEVQFDWTPYGHQRERDLTTGTIDRAGRVGDVTIAWRQNLRNPDGKGLSYGVQPFVTVPIGRTPIGAGDWGAGLIVPVTYDLAEGINIGATGEVDAAVDEDGHGRHVSANGVAAVSLDLTQALSATIEAELLRDDDPSGATTQALAGLGLTWKVARTRALYAEAVAGLNHAAPDIRLYGGIAALF